MDIPVATPNLHADASASGGGGVGAGATASFTDTPDFSNALPVDSVTLDFSVNGSLSGTGAATLSAQWGSKQQSFNLSGGDQAFAVEISPYDLAETGTTLSGPITISLTASANSPSMSQSGEADFSNTVKRGGIQALDANLSA